MKFSLLYYSLFQTASRTNIQLVEDSPHHDGSVLLQPLPFLWCGDPSLGHLDAGEQDLRLYDDFLPVQRSGDPAHQHGSIRDQSERHAGLVQDGVRPHSPAWRTLPDH